MQRAVCLFETRTEPARDAALELVGARRVRTTELRLICGLCVGTVWSRRVTVLQNGDGWSSESSG